MAVALASCSRPPAAARDTGAPVVPVVERPVPQGGAPGEVLAPTTIRPRDAFGILPWGNDRCRRAIAAARHEGLYTPPSLQGAILYPFTGGGVNWGGLAFDAGRQYVVIAAGGHARTDTRRGDQVIAYALPR